MEDKARTSIGALENDRGEEDKREREMEEEILSFLR